MSQFGADIFDDDPPTKPPTRKGRKSTVSTPTDAVGDEAAQAKNQAEQKPRRRASRRRKGGEEPNRDATAPTIERPSTAAAPEPSGRDVAEAEAQQAAGSPAATEPEGRKGRGRRKSRSDRVAKEAEDTDSPPAPAELDAPSSPSESPAPDATTGSGPEWGPAAPAEAEGSVNDAPSDVAASPPAQRPEDGDDRYPRFGDDRRRRRRRRRRGRRGDREERDERHGSNRGADLQDRERTATFERDPHSEPDRSAGNRDSFPHDPSGPHSHLGRQRPMPNDQEAHGADGWEDRQPRARRKPHSEFRPATPPPAPPQSRRIAILLDLAQLAEEAHDHGGEIAYRKLRASVAGPDEVLHALCFATRDLPETARRVLANQGFNIEDCADAQGCAEALIDQASRAQWPVDALVVVGVRDRTRLPDIAGGAAIETAEFDGNGMSEAPRRSLPRSLLFVP